jgi:hypothetical protein
MYAQPGPTRTSLYAALRAAHRGHVTPTLTAARAARGTSRSTSRRCGRRCTARAPRRATRRPTGTRAEAPANVTASERAARAAKRSTKPSERAAERNTKPFNGRRIGRDRCRGGITSALHRALVAANARSRALAFERRLLRLTACGDSGARAWISESSVPPLVCDWCLWLPVRLPTAHSPYH